MNVTDRLSSAETNAGTPAPNPRGNAPEKLSAIETQVGTQSPLPPKDHETVTDMGEANTVAPDLAPGHQDQVRSETTESGVWNMSIPPLTRELPERAPTPAEVCCEIGLYQVVGKIGSGGMGDVYAAWHPSRRCYVAVKTIRSALLLDGRDHQAVKRFLREAGLLISVDHPNVVRCFDVNKLRVGAHEVVYMVLELLSGESLSARIRRQPLSLDEALDVALAAANALDALHSGSPMILHRDIKPSNIHMTTGGTVKLLDFGLAVGEDWRTQMSVMAGGTQHYMPPEQFSGLDQCTPRSDLYSLGATLFEMVTGTVPFEGHSGIDLYLAHKQTSPPDIMGLVPASAHSPRLIQFNKIIRRLLRKEPRDRYASAKDLIAALEQVRAGATIRIPLPVVRWLKVATKSAGAALLVGGLVFATVRMVAYVSESLLPEKIARMEELRASYKFAEGRQVALQALRDAPQDTRIQTYLRELSLAVGQRNKVLEHQARATAAQQSGKLAVWVAELEALAQQAKASAVFSPSEIVDYARTAEAAEAERARAFTAALQNHSPEEMAALPTLARTDAERTALARLSTQSRHDQTLATARSLFTRAQLGKSEEALATLDGASLATDVQSKLRRLRGDIASARALQTQVAEARALLVAGDLARARELLQSAQARVGANPALLEAAGLEAAELSDMVAEVDEQEALARIEAAVATGDAAQLKAVLADVRASGRIRSNEGQLTLMEQSDRLRTMSFAADLRTATAAATSGQDLASGEQAARRALANLPVREQTAFAQLARNFVRTKETQGEAKARAQLVAALPTTPQAQAAWLVLERLVALREQRLDACLIQRTNQVTLGTADPSHNNPKHVVSLPPFYLDRLETSHAVLARFAASHQAAPGRMQQPVAGISFAQAQTHAKVMGKRLPTADEWELAASLGAKGAHRLYPWGEQWRDEVARPDASDPLPVGVNALDVAPCGARDMGGNVQEWTLDPHTGAAILQGGSYRLGAYPELFVASHRSQPTDAGTHVTFPDAGMRCAQNVPAPDISAFTRTK